MKRFSKTICVLTAITAATAMAENQAPEVTLTSFSMAGSATNAAEICGKVSGVTAPSVVHITVDESSKRPGNYSALVEADGQFCTAVVTYRRTAVASVSFLGSHAMSRRVAIEASELK